MTLKDMGNKKKVKKQKCANCRTQIEICEDNIEKVGSVKILTCPICDTQTVMN